MEFHERRRQQFLAERQYRFALDSFEEVVHGPEGLLDNLTKPDDPPGWHKNLMQSIGDEHFNLLLMRYTAGEAIESLRAQLETVVAAYERYGPSLWAYPKDLVAWCRANSALSEDADKRALRLRCAAGQPCPRAGFWFTPAWPDSRRQFAIGETMPDYGGDYGATIWQWDDRQ